MMTDAQPLLEVEKAALRVVRALRTSHIHGAYMSPPEAVHDRSCPLTKLGKRRGKCNCGGDELDNEMHAALMGLWEVVKEFDYK